MRCEAIGCLAEGDVAVLAPPLFAVTRDHPDYEPPEPAQMCAEHAREVRLRATQPFMLRILSTREQFAEVVQRVEAAVPGMAEPEDLAFLDRYVDDARQVSLIAEGEQDPGWQGSAAGMEAAATMIEQLLRRHLS